MPPNGTLQEDPPGDEEEVRAHLILSDLWWTIAYTVVSALLGLGLEVLETGLVEPAQLAVRPYDIFAIYYEFLLGSFGVLFSIYLVAPIDEGGELNTTFIVLLVAAAAAYISTAIAGLYLGNPPTGFAYLLFRVVFPDVAGVTSLIWSVLVTRLVARKVAYGVGS